MGILRKYPPGGNEAKKKKKNGFWITSGIFVVLYSPNFLSERRNGASHKLRKTCKHKI